MNLIITSGMDHRWCEFAHNQLLKMGLQPPRAGEQTGINPEQLIGKMTSAYTANKGPGNGLAPLKPGKAWELAASDLVLANADKEYWGWCSPNNLQFLDFWSEFEPNARFVLIYGSAHETLGRSLDQYNLSSENVDAFISRWREYHESLLRFFHANPERSALIHVREFQVGEQHIVDLINSRLGVSLKVPGSSDVYERSALDELIARIFTENSPSVESLLEEMHNSADIPRMRSNTVATIDGLSAAVELAELRNSVTELLTVKEELRVERAEMVTIDAEIIELQNTVKQLKLTNKKLHAEKVELERTAVTDRNLSSKNALLSAQIQQLHNDLERQAKRTRESQEESRTDFDAQALSSDESNADFSIDMKSIISGQGWHDAEPHGRWAGASARSVLRIPSLDAHQYELIVKIVDTISLEHLMQLAVFFDDQPLTGRLKILTNLGGRLAPLRRLRAKIRRHTNPVPAEFRAIIPAELVAAGDKAHLLSFSSSPSVRPSEQGAGDTRPLSVCVERVEIRKVR